MKLSLPKSWFKKRIPKEEGDIDVSLEPIHFDNPKTSLSTSDILARARETETDTGLKVDELKRAHGEPVPFPVTNYLRTVGFDSDIGITMTDLENVVQQAFTDGRVAEQVKQTNRAAEYKTYPTFCQLNLFIGQLMQKVKYLSLLHSCNDEIADSAEICSDIERALKALEMEMN